MSGSIATVAGGGSIESAMLAGATAMGFNWAGGIGDKLFVERLLAHALVGCVQGAASGGKCGPGAASAFAGKLMTGGAEHLKLTGAAKAIATVVAGGTASVVGGGKFANGALTAGMGYLFNCLRHECLVQGWDAERTFTNYLRTNADPSLQLGYNTWYDSQGNFFWRRPDIYSESLRMVWDVKPDSYYGWGSGAAQIGMYTANGIYSPGAGAPLFGTRDSITLTGCMNRYEFRFGGRGLVIYRRLDASPMLRSLRRAFQNQAAQTLSGPPRRRSGLFEYE